MKKRIVIVGGGASGWLSALYVNDLYKHEADITLIESKDIGILGAGEGSVPVFTDFLDKLNIDLTEFLIEVNGTHKLGISFENWNGDGKNYMHDFFSAESIIKNVPREDYIGYLLKNKFDINEYSISKKMAYDNKSPLGNHNDMDSKIPFVTYAFHFDAHLMASYLRKISEQRGIKRIEGLVTGFTQNTIGDVDSIQLENGESVYIYVTHSDLNSAFNWGPKNESEAAAFSLFSTLGQVSCISIILITGSNACSSNVKEIPSQLKLLCHPRFINAVAFLVP